MVDELILADGPISSGKKIEKPTYTKLNKLNFIRLKFISIFVHIFVKPHKWRIHIDWIERNQVRIQSV